MPIRPPRRWADGALVAKGRGQAGDGVGNHFGKIKHSRVLWNTMGGEKMRDDCLVDLPLSHPNEGDVEVLSMSFGQYVVVETFRRE